MDEDSSSQALLSNNESYSFKKKGPDEIIPFFLLLITASGMGISGVSWALYVFKIKGFFWMFFVLVLFSITNYFNHMIIVRACYEINQFSFSKLITHHWGRKRGLFVQIAMAIQCLITITYLQQRVAVNTFKIFHTEVSVFPDYSDIFYYAALANIPLILLALKNDYEKIRWFAIIGVLCWAYLFIGIITEASANDDHFFSDAGQMLPESGKWMIISIGLLGYFTSSLQVLPYISEQVNHEETMKTIVFKSSIGTFVIITTVILYFAFSANPEIDFLRYTGFTLIGICVAIINVFPTRELIVQILENNAKDKVNTRDRFITICLLSLTLILSIFINEVETFQLFIGFATMLAGLFGFFFPGILFFKIAKDREDTYKFLVLVWNIIVGHYVFVAGILMIFAEKNTEVIKHQ